MYVCIIYNRNGTIKYVSTVRGWGLGYWWCNVFLAFNQVMNTISRHRFGENILNLVYIKNLFVGDSVAVLLLLIVHTYTEDTYHPMLKWWPMRVKWWFQFENFVLHSAVGWNSSVGFEIVVTHTHLRFACFILFTENLTLIRSFKYFFWDFLLKLSKYYICFPVTRNFM